MADYIIKGISVTNPNATEATLNYGLTSNLGSTTTIGAKSTISLSVESDTTTATVYFKLTATDWKDSSVVSKSFTYNPLNDVEVSISGGYDSTSGMYVEKVTLTNQSPEDLTINGTPESTDIFFGQSGTSSNVVAADAGIVLASGDSALYVTVSSSDSNGSYDFMIRSADEEYEEVEYKS